MEASTLSFTDWLKQCIETPSRESAIGHHYILTYMQDPYSFYLKYVRGLKPVNTKPALIKGGIIHSAIEAAYLYDAEAMFNTLNALFAHRATEYADNEQRITDWNSATKMLDKWAATWLDHDRKTYHILHLEEEFTLPLVNGYTITVRPDIILEAKDDAEIRALDHKTTGWSLMKAHQDLADSDQSTTYIFAMRKLYPNNRILGVESDVIFKRDNMAEAKAERVGIIQRTDWYISQWELSTISWLQRIAQSVAMLRNGYPAPFAFPRGQNYWGTSDWPDIYRAELPSDEDEPPYGYTIDAWQRERITASLQMQEVIDNARE